jgi:hypothetical protein
MRVMLVRAVSALCEHHQIIEGARKNYVESKQYNKYSNIIIKRQKSSFVFFNNPPYSFTLFLRRFYNICIQNEVPPPWYTNGTLSALLEASMASPTNVV